MGEYMYISPHVIIFKYYITIYYRTNHILENQNFLCTTPINNDKIRITYQRVMSSIAYIAYI